MTDLETIAVYDAKAQDYVDLVSTDKPNRHLRAFIAALPSGGHALDIGCGPGNSAAAMIAAGLTVKAIDPSTEMVALGSKKFGIDITQGTYDDITETAQYDGIWSSFSMLHIPRVDVPRHLAAMRKALKPNGTLVIGVKTGTGEERDGIGRRYTYFTRTELDSLLIDAGLTPTHHFEGEEAGLAGTIDPFIIVTAHA
ncbi:class I SAM-dependent methyltransferase [Amylibacter sp. IMCC11727]|uniref:class I SAM-dependent methyltransferase n=1 Tax=Amylibacter sp. IMCC11727 TaxID=3039851 RepID=UPI00244E18C8|nr:class I SAM-dependent methyltransferase [Amylibacter sp. IMCC11727]WGI22523.1 class I SAM-dependent methyltransferase [Amylibacter sp. IMCC11727]